MKNKIKVIAIIVTYNREKLLERCISNLKKQIRKPDEILVINNGSKDGTKEMLQNLNINTINQENLGSSGGWKSGMKFAIENSFDAAWLMDDDGFPDAYALDNLLNNWNEKFSCISSLVVDEDNKNKLVFGMPVLDDMGYPVLFKFPRKFDSLNTLKKKINDKSYYPFAHLFNGALISIDAAKKIGNINENYFLYGDEVDYFYRLRSYGEVISVKNAYHYHPNVSQRGYTNQKIYYFIKNTIILNKKYLNHVHMRNLLTILIALIRVTKRNGLLSLFSLLVGKNKKCFYPAIFRGLKGHLRKDYAE